MRHNIPLLKNIVMHPAFLESNIDTTFLEKYNELYEYPRAKDRATKVLAYIANVTVNDPHNLGKQRFRAVSDAPNLKDNSKQYEKYILAPNTPTAKKIFDQSGPSGLTQWLRNHKPTLLTDTTMRDAHQSLFATRLRTRDMLKAADFYKNYAQHFFSLEVWGGATFDTCLRFLKEDPWERLATIREAIPNVLLQMLLRGDNAVGYSNYPSWVVREFIKETVRHGLEVFRIFDCLNQPDKMQIAVDEVKKQGAIAEISLCYTGNITDLKKCKYDLKYYLDIAKELEAMGADILCVKDMAGLLRPSAAKLLITALKDTVSLPIHLHTHDTSGVGVSMQIEAAKAGCDIIDGAVSSMSGLTSQPSLNALIAALEDSDIAPEVPLPVVDRLARYWEQVRTMYQAFDPGIKSTSTDVYDHEIPGGQYSNLFNQAMKVGLSADDFYELTQRYAEVNTLFGDIIKVTPSSKVVGDMALLLQKQGLTGPSYLQEKPALDYPDSVVSFFKGHMGEPYGGFPEEVRTLVLGENAPPPEAIEVSSDDSLDSIKEFLLNQRGNSDQEITNAQALSYRLYPKVYQEFQNHQKQYGEASGLTTPVFFYGMQQGEEIETDLEPGKTLVISMQGMSQTDENGMRKVFFNLNGFSRQIEVVDQSSESALKKRPTAEANNELHIGAAMPGKVLEVRVTAGTHVKQGDIVLITESMKMEYTITAKTSGIVKSIYVQQLDQVESGDLLVELENAPA
ncbi:MAG: pyruvate carboxylase subunit B [Bdellovibrionota bacterium]